MEVRGHTGTVHLNDEFLTISRKGFLARVSVGKGDKRIPIRQITAVQFKPAGPLVNGFIQFTVGGANERRSRFGHQTADATRDENSVTFHYRQRAAFAALREAVEQVIAEHGRATQTNSPSSIPDQIEQLARLRDRGVLTVSEYEAKKAELLARM